MEDIKQILKMPGWEMIVDIFNEEIEKGLNCENINTEIDSENVALQVISRKEAAKIVKSSLLRITRIGAEESKVEPKRYI